VSKQIEETDFNITVILYVPIMTFVTSVEVVVVLILYPLETILFSLHPSTQITIYKFGFCIICSSIKQRLYLIIVKENYNSGDKAWLGSQKKNPT
jgi:hypothetical protein